MQPLRRGIRIFAALGAWLAGVSCGGDSDAGAGCGPFTPCGGDPTGLWQAQSACSEIAFEGVAAAAGLPPECGDALRVSSVRQEGTLSIGVGTYDQNIETTLDWEIRLDLSCINAIAEVPITAAQVPAFCDEFQEEALSGADSPFSNVTCRVAGNGCVCDGPQNGLIATSGTLQIQGSNLLFDNGDNRQFCVNGDALVLQTEDPMIGLFQVTYTRATP